MDVIIWLVYIAAWAGFIIYGSFLFGILFSMITGIDLDMLSEKNKHMRTKG